MKIFRTQPKKSTLQSRGIDSRKQMPWRSLGQALVGSDSAAEAAARPVLAEYRRGLPLAQQTTLFVLLVGSCLILGILFANMAPARMMPFSAPVALLMGLTIWSIPSGEHAPTNLLAGLYVAFFASFVLWPNYLAIALPGLPWVTLLRLTTAPLIGTFMICLMASRPFRARMREILSTDPWLWRLLVGFVAAQAITVPLSGDIGTSINRFIVNQCNLTAIFFVSCYMFSRRGFAELWVYLLLTMLTILCLLGIWEARLGEVLWAGHIPSFLRVGDEAVIRILQGAARHATGSHRVQAVQTTPLGFAELLGLAVPFAVHLMVNRYPRIVRLLSGAFIPLSFIVINLTDSRLGVVAAGGSILFYALFWGLLRWRNDRRSLLGPAVVLSYPLLFAAVVLSTFFVGRIRAEVWGNGPQQASNDARQLQWEMAIPKVLKNPVGHGAGQSGDVLGFTSPSGVVTVDSYYITTLLDWGIVGFSMFFGLIARSIYCGSRTALAASGDRETRLLVPLSVALANFIIVKAVLSQDFNHIVVFMMLGAVLALVSRTQLEPAAR